MFFLNFFPKLKGNEQVLSNNTIRRCNMLELKNKELLNIQGGASISTLPNFRAYSKLFSWIYKTICSWF